MSPLKPLSVSTAGVHPLVKKVESARIKAQKPFSIKARARAMASIPGVKKPLMSRAELREVRTETGRLPRG